MRRLLILSLTLAVFMSLAGGASALGVTIYTDKTAWVDVLGGIYLTEDFSDAQLNPGVSYSSSESGGINTKFGYYHDVLNSDSQNEPMTTWSFTPQIFAYGGTWTLGGPGGSGNSLQVYIADFGYRVGGISSSYNGDFWGFIADTPFTSVLLVGGSGRNQQIYKLDDMVYSQVAGVGESIIPAGAAAAIPLPPSVLFLGTGLLGLAGWRRFRTS